MAKQARRWSVVLLLLVAAGGVAGWRSLAWWESATAAPMAVAAQSTKSIKLRIPEGHSAQEIGQDLQAAGLIRSTTAWNLWARWLSSQDSQGGFQAGTYELSPTQTMQAIAATIWAGDVVRQSFTIPEGWSIRQMAVYFEQQKLFSAQAFLAAANQISTAEYPWLPTVAADYPRLEGYLFPDTYELDEIPVSPEQVIRRMLDRFEQVALPIYRQTQGQTQLTLQQWVTLASVVEKEAVVPNERARIAGVFTNRLRQEMPLGADPTVEYGLGIQQTPDRTLTLKEVATPSPYNTYINPGLPPTPIASPGLESLKATLNPEATDYLYFVARYDGTHIFSRTFEEHQAAQSAIHDQRDQAQPTTPQARPTSSPSTRSSN